MKKLSHSILIVIIGCTISTAGILDSIKSIKIKVTWYSFKNVRISKSDTTDFYVTHAAVSDNFKSSLLKDILNRASIKSISDDELVGVCMDGPDNDVHMELINSRNDTLILEFSCATFVGECFMHDKGYRYFNKKDFKSAKLPDNAKKYWVSFNKNDQKKLYELFSSMNLLHE